MESDAAFVFKEMLKMKRRQMSPGNRARTKSPTIKIKWLYPFATERQYRKYLFDLMDIFSDVAIPTLKNNLQRWVEEQRQDTRQDDFQMEFQQLINELEQTQYDMFYPDGKGKEEYNNVAILGTLATVGWAVSNFNDKQSQKFTKKILGQPFLPGEQTWLFSAVDLWSNANFGLIKSLSNEYIKKLNFIVSDGVMEGRTWNAMMKDVRAMDKNITRTRARLLTRDQVGKLNGRLTKRRQQEIGIDMYEWMTAMDERVRPTDPKLVSSKSVPNHRLMNGTYNRWDDSTVLSTDRGKTWKSRPSNMQGAIPGSQIQCRCTSGAVFDDIIEEVDKELKQEEQKAVVEKVEKPVVKKPKKRVVKKKKPNKFDKEFGKNSLGEIKTHDPKKPYKISDKNRRSLEEVREKYEGYLHNSFGEDAVRLEDEIFEMWGYNSDNIPTMNLWAEERKRVKTYYHKKWIDNIKKRREEFKAIALLNRKRMEKFLVGMEGKTNIILDSQYEFSQHILKQIFPKGKVKLFRGVSRNYFLNQGIKPADIMKGKVKINSLSSWAFSKEKAKSYAKLGGFVFETEIPIEKIFSTDLSANFGISQGEAIVIGGDVKVVIEEIVK